jgi:WD40 repeat protein
MFADDRLGGSFFCSRDSADRSNLRLIFPTLAVQLARKYPEFRSTLVPLVRSDPECSTESLYNQMRRMIVGPLKESRISTVIVIDALDECKDNKPESAILSVLGQFTSEVPNVKFFLTGRPESHILRGFNLPEMVEARDVFILHEVGSSEIGSDIRQFFEHWFSDIVRRQPGLDDWPTTQQLDRLCERAAGLFIYAMATVKFIDDHDPRERLDLLLQSPESSAREGETELMENATLDSLYTSILQRAFGNKGPEDDRKLRSVLGTVVFVANPLSPSAIATLLNSNTGAVFSRLSSIHSLLILQKDVNVRVLPFHKSFPDFITNPTRCINKRFYISPSDHHLELLVGCLNLMGRRLEENMCGLPDAVTNDEVDNLDEKVRLSIDGGLKYACESWHKHLVDECTARAPEVSSALHRFLGEKFLCWLEVLSVLGSVGEAVDALGTAARLLEVCRVTHSAHFPNLLRLIQESPTLDLVYDCFRFVTGFFEVICTSAPHIYNSALSLSPQTSIVRELYKSHARPLTRIVHGLPTSWDPSIMVERVASVVQRAVWSPNSKSIAVAWHSGEQTTIEILDAVTLQRLTVLKPGLGQTRWLIFSPDSRLLTWFGGSPMKCISWDLRTGVQLSATPPEPAWIPWSIEQRFSITYSECGTMLGILFLNVEPSTIYIYNVLSGTPARTHSHRTGRALGEVWTHGECVRYTTFASGSIIIWEFGFNSRHEPTQAEVLSTPDNFDPSGEFLIHPTLSRLAFVDQSFDQRAVLVWDSREFRFLLNSEDLENPVGGMSFSLDGHFFACATIGGAIYLWKESPIGYVLHKKLNHGNITSPIRISPDGGSIISWGISGVQVWRTMDPVTSLSGSSTQIPPRTGTFMVEFSSDEVYAAITQLWSNVVTVLDLESGDTRLVIDTGVKVHGLGVGRSTIVVVGQGKIVTWDLPTGTRALNARANIDDGARIRTFAQPLLSLHLYYPPLSISTDLHRMVIVGEPGGSNLHLYNVSTGQSLASASMERWGMARFALGGHEVWCWIGDDKAEGWSIVEDSEFDVTRLERIGVTADPPGGLPWASSRGYEVTDDGWVLSPSAKRLLWLPPYLRLDRTYRVWSGRFLAFLDPELSEPVLLELPAE